MLFQSLTNRTELNSHADTCVAGANIALYAETGETVTVSPFSSEYAALPDILVGTVMTVYDDPRDGQSYLLVIHEAFYFGDRMSHSLIYPNQLRSFGVKVHDTFLQFGAENHCIEVPEYDLSLPLEVDGTVSYLETRLLTPEEIDSLHWVELSSDIP
jgi:hypothetical protein